MEKPKTKIPASLRLKMKERGDKKTAHQNKERCLICSRRPLKITQHHLEPTLSTKEPKKGGTIKLCRTCHNFLHTIWTNAELRMGLNSQEKLLADPYVLLFGAEVHGMDIFETYTKREIYRKIGFKENPQKDPIQK